MSSIPAGPFSFHADRLGALSQALRSHVLPGGEFKIGDLYLHPIAETSEEDLATALEWHREKGEANRIADGYLAVLAIGSYEIDIFTGPEQINGGVLRDIDQAPSLVVTFIIPHEGCFETQEHHGPEVFSTTEGEEGVRAVVEWIVGEANRVWRQSVPGSITALAR